MINSWVPAATDSTLCPHRLAAGLEDSEPVSPQAAEGSPELGSALDKSQPKSSAEFVLWRRSSASLRSACRAAGLGQRNLTRRCVHPLGRGRA